MTKALLRRWFDIPRFLAQPPAAKSGRSLIALTCFLSMLVPAAAEGLTPQGDKLMSQSYRQGILTKVTQHCMAHYTMLIGVPQEITVSFCNCTARLTFDTFSPEEVLGLLTLDREQRQRDPKLAAGSASINKACNAEAKQKWKEQQELKKREMETQRDLKKGVSR